jgi:hypothetical protein
MIYDRDAMYSFLQFFPCGEISEPQRRTRAALCALQLSTAALRMMGAPVREARITDHVWTWQELLPHLEKQSIEIKFVKTSLCQIRLNRRMDV